MSGSIFQADKILRILGVDKPISAENGKVHEDLAY